LTGSFSARAGPIDAFSLVDRASSTTGSVSEVEVREERTK
jgi:hypothetical protein